MKTSITNWEVHEPAQLRPHYVHEFIGIDGRLPPDLDGKDLNEIACFTPDPHLRTLDAESLAPIKRGDRIKHFGLVFEVRKIDGHRFHAVEVLESSKQYFQYDDEDRRNI